MAEILETILSNVFNYHFRVLISIYLKSVSNGQIDVALAPVMVWRRIGDKPLPEPALIQFTGAYMRRFGTMNQIH